MTDVRAAFVVHLFYEDEARDLVRSLGALRLPIDVFVTAPEPPSEKVSAALRGLAGRVEIVGTDNRGRDVGPFLDLLPRLIEDGYDVFCKLHTKRGASGYAAEWRGGLVRPLIGSAALVERILDTFAADDQLAILGPADLYLSVARHLPANPGDVARLARLSFPGKNLPEDWGFFAGTMFWGRVPAFRGLAALPGLGVAMAEPRREGDGGAEHALERVFGLAGAVDGGRVGLVSRDGEVRVVDGAGAPPATTLREALTGYKLKRPYDSDDVLDIAKRINPLLHYIRHPTETHADPNPYFHNSWYMTAYPEAAESPTPLSHYIRIGARTGANPSPAFNTGFYLRQHPELVGAGVNPLAHFLDFGAAAGAAALPDYEADTDADWLREPQCRWDFDEALERAFLDRMRDVGFARREQAAAEKVSVILPLAGSPTDAAARLKSVLAQTHATLEVIVVGGEVPQYVSDDPRVGHLDVVSDDLVAARNAGLRVASGSIVAYLDPGHVWRPDFLSTMVAFMTADGLDLAGCTVEEPVGAGATVFTGGQFDQGTLSDHGAAVLSAFCHRRGLAVTHGGFDERLAAGAECDLLVRYAAAATPGHASFRGCRAMAREGRGRAPPPALNALLRARSRPDGDPAQALSLAFGIKISALRGQRYGPFRRWGDYHFAEALGRALVRMGHTVHIDPPWRWYETGRPRDDVVIAIRGMLPYEPRPEDLNVLWNISRPDHVAFDEYDTFDVVYVASASYTGFLRTILERPVDVLLQATDPERFHPPAHSAVQRHDALFVGSRYRFLTARTVLAWALELGLNVDVYGTGWQGEVPAGMFRGAYIPNDRLAEHYAGARVTLNDHHPAMRDFGFASNRVFDVIASGGRLLSDRVPAIGRLFGLAVTTVETRDAFQEAVESILADGSPPDQDADAPDRVASQHSFDKRAQVIVRHVFAHLSGASSGVGGVDVRGSRQPRRVHVLVRPAPNGPDDAAYFRLLSPLTQDEVGLSVTFGKISDRCDTLADVCIAQAGAASDAGEARDFAARLRSFRIPLIVDLDGRPDPILAPHADQIWVPDLDLDANGSAASASVHIVSSAADPRLWRRYDNRAKNRATSDTALLYVDRPSDPNGLAMLCEALDSVADGRFTLTIIGAPRHLPIRDWLRQVSPPPLAASYPRFARWLRDLGGFDVGLVPATGIDAMFRAAEFRAMGMIAVGAVGSPGMLTPAEATADAWGRLLTVMLRLRLESPDGQATPLSPEIAQVARRQAALIEEAIAARQADGVSGPAAG